MNLTLQEILFLQNRVAYTRDEQSYKKLFLHFHPQLYRFSYNICKDKCVSEEVVSDVFMKLWLMDEKLANVQDLRLYLMASIKNVTLTAITSNKSSNMVTTMDDKEYFIVDKAENPEQQCIISEAIRQVNSIISTLPTRCQMVFRLIKEERMTYREVAAIMNISQNTIETHMRIALKKIRSEIRSAY